MSRSSLAPGVAIFGPTASGKTEMALRLASRHDAEIVNFDSVQVYRYLDIGSAKTPLQDRGGIPHHLIDHVEPSESYSAGEFARDARAVLGQLRQRETMPVLVGGTGFYLDATINGLFEGPQRNPTLRQRLEQTAAQRPAGHLWRILARLDPTAAKSIHPNDSPKIVRAIEVCLLGQKPMTEQWQDSGERLEGYRILFLGLDPPRELLYARIEDRARRMFAEGLIEEVRGLLRRDIPRDWWPLGALGYAQCLLYLDGKCGLQDAIAATALQTRRYAKRQLTWLRGRVPGIRWLHRFGESPEAADWAEAEFQRWL